ncbi:MAG: Threonine--tRNA ligase [Candidatus Moanabacter tarae]|uniref:Threonine--tRNA ligase n=1 Tax=Candidatus Moanibacter tarae TaxID=2200854 RepID=A0A2Z4AGV9_9BACT|nr:MAG: Threonine--tRNA ligase [Candidatus Moanabacter tarae]|tara:strand:- start:40963 stop:42780 length:1818 start_codon:yes stop_codon:yes gene_type:complete
MTPLEELRHSAAHIMATAVMRIFPDTKLDIGPPTNTGFYYDFDLDHKFTTEDLEKIEGEMGRVVKENQKFERIEVTRHEAEEYFNQIGQPYKIERLRDIPPGESITYYRNGEFTDLCAGSHVRYTKQVKAFKLLSVAGAYHKGDEQNKQLQRIYGTAFPNKDELLDYLNQLEEARSRDHRTIGKDLKLFHLDDTVGQGLVLWSPKGAIIRQELQDFISEELRKQGYQQVFTPHIGRLELYRTSGHYPYYKESQYPPLIGREEIDQLARDGCSCAELSNRLETGDIEGYLLKPMNCPFHIKIYSSQQRSYRDLPVRLAEFGTVYRWEKSGELSGMTRVRSITQDDAHLFCTEDQVKTELSGCLKLVKTIFETLGISEYRIRVCLRDPDTSKYVGNTKLWDKAEEILRKEAKTLGAPFSEEPGEAAFYGPKIDFVVKDVIGREWQLGTVQLDYSLPDRFDLSYIGPDNKPHRPVMIHRAPFGSMERFVGVLIEHFAGSFPTWLSPEQARILPITDDQNTYAKSILQDLTDNHLRASIDFQADKLGAKIRRAENDKVPYMIVIGAKELESNHVSIRSRVNKQMEGTYSVKKFIRGIEEEIADRTLPNR